jgi:hypothetical protein
LDGADQFSFAVCAWRPGTALVRPGAVGASQWPATAALGALRPIAFCAYTWYVQPPVALVDPHGTVTLVVTGPGSENGPLNGPAPSTWTSY